MRTQASLAEAATICEGLKGRLQSLQADAAGRATDERARLEHFHARITNLVTFGNQTCHRYSNRFVN